MVYLDHPISSEAMHTWSDIQSKILFSYLGCDWTSVDVVGKESTQIEHFLESKFESFRSTSPSIACFEVHEVKVYFYLNSDDHNFDFDPKQIITEDQWNNFLEAFIQLSKQLDSDVHLRPEDSNRGEDVLVCITGDEVTYDFDVHLSYQD